MGARSIIAGLAMLKESLPHGLDSNGNGKRSCR